MAAVEPPEGDVLDSTRAGGLVIRGGIVRGAGYALNTLLALLGMALVTRHLGVVDFGQFQTVISLITIVGTVTDAGMATLGLREYAQRTGAERERLMRSLLGLRLVLTFAGVAIAAAIAAAIGYDAELVLGTVLAGLGLSFTVVQTTLTIPLAAELRNVALTALEILRQLLTVGGYVLLVVLGAGVVAFLGVTVPVGVVLVIAAAVLVRGLAPLVPSRQVRDWGRLLRAAVAFSMATAVGTVYLYAAQIMTAAVTDGRETGLFSASFRVFVVAASIPGLLIVVAFPLLSRAARDDRGRLAYALQRLVDTSALLGCGAALAIIVAAPTIIDVMAGPRFADAVDPLRIQGATLAATFLLAPMGFTLLSVHAHRELLLANLAALLVIVASVTALASTLGPEGAALGTAIGEVFLAVSYVVALRHAASDIVPGFGRAARALVAAAPCLLALLLVPTIPAWLAALPALLVYVALLLGLRAVPDELLELVPRRRGSRP